MVTLKTPVPSDTSSAPTPEGAQTLERSMSELQQQCAEILAQVTAMREQISELTQRETELRAILQRDTELDPQIPLLDKIFRKTWIAERIAASIEQAELRTEPCPYAVIDDLLPLVLYEALVMGLPPLEQFEGKPVGKQHMDVPFSLAPLFSRRIWRYMATEMVPKAIGTSLLAKFRPHIDTWITANWPGVDPASVDLHTSGGRIMFRRRGYRIRPHRDPKWSFLTCILYLARPGDSETWGTQMYAVDQDQEAKSAAPYWIDEKQCRLVEDVGFVANRLLVFLNSTGAHGAHIPSEAQPEMLERYIYQFRLGPSVETTTRLRSLLPEERQPLWAGKALLDY